MDERTCSKCGKTKPADHKYFMPRFYPKRGFSSWCRACHYRWAQAKRTKRYVTLAGRPLPDVCELCGEAPPADRMLSFDHDHTTGGFRGWICARCNTVLGHVGD